jgi:hypothetical protein
MVSARCNVFRYLSKLTTCYVSFDPVPDEKTVGNGMENPIGATLDFHLVSQRQDGARISIRRELNLGEPHADYLSLEFSVAFSPLFRSDLIWGFLLRALHKPLPSLQIRLSGVAKAE